MREIRRTAFREIHPTRRGLREEHYVVFAGVGQAEGREPVAVLFWSDALDYGAIVLSADKAAVAVAERKGQPEQWVLIGERLEQGH